MKTQIIQLESHDDVISVKDKMGWSQTPRILLVWPRGEKILNRRIDLKYLLRHSKSLGAQLALIVKDSRIREYAKVYDIPIYPNINKAEKSHWRSRRRKKVFSFIRNGRKTANGTNQNVDRRRTIEELRNRAYPVPPRWLSHPISRFVFFTFGVLGILAVGAVLVPRAEISVSPIKKWVSIPIPLTADLDTEKVEISGIIPIRRLNLIVEGFSKIKSSGTISIPDNFAVGNVFFTNLTEREIDIPVGTIISTVGEHVTRFETLQGGFILPGQETKLIPIKATNPGISGNVPKNTIIAIEGPLGLDLTVTNQSNTSRGTERKSPAPIEQDYQSLREELLNTLYQASLAEIEQNLNKDDIILISDPTDYQIIKEVYTPDPNMPADELSLNLSVEYLVYYASSEDITALSGLILNSNLPDGFSPIPSTMDYINKKPPQLNEEGNYNWDIEARWQTVALINNNVVNLVLWLDPVDAAKKLSSSLPIDKNVTISLNPSWWPRLPILPFRLTLSTTED